MLPNGSGPKTRFRLHARLYGSRLVNPRFGRVRRRKSAAGSVRRAAGFTLPELLIVIAIIGTVAALVFPAAGRLRRGARDVICQSRLRSLALACETYRSTNNAYPSLAPTAAQSTAADQSTVLTGLTGLLTPLLRGAVPDPHRVDLNLLNQLSGLVGFRRLDPATPAIDLPAEIQSPDVESLAEARGPFPTTSGQAASYYTGFAYVAGLDAANAGPRVLWTDDVHVATAAAGGTWQYAHADSGAVAGAQPLTYADGSRCRGQHRVYADGSSVWVPGATLRLAAPPVYTLTGRASAPADVTYTRQVGDAYWWY